MIQSTFEYPKKGRVINHLSRKALENYSKVMGGTLQVHFYSNELIASLRCFEECDDGREIGVIL